MSSKTDCPQRHQNIVCAVAITRLVRRNGLSCCDASCVSTNAPGDAESDISLRHAIRSATTPSPHPYKPSLFWPPQGIRLLLSYPLPLIDSCIPLRACSFSPYICIQQERVSHVMRQIMNQVISEQWHVSVRFITCWQWSSPSAGLKILGTLQKITFSTYHKLRFRNVDHTSNTGVLYYNFAYCFVWVWNLVTHIEGDT